jgi:hypothetical protein
MTVAKDNDTVCTIRPHNTPVTKRAASRGTLNNTSFTASSINLSKIDRYVAKDGGRNSKKKPTGSLETHHELMMSMLRKNLVKGQRLNEEINNANVANFNNRKNYVVEEDNEVVECSAAVADVDAVDVFTVK